jgi:hypothetical protein
LRTAPSREGSVGTVVDEGDSPGMDSMDSRMAQPSHCKPSASSLD